MDYVRLAYLVCWSIGMAKIVRCSFSRHESYQPNYSGVSKPWEASGKLFSAFIRINAIILTISGWFNIVILAYSLIYSFIFSSSVDQKEYKKVYWSHICSSTFIFIINELMHLCAFSHFSQLFLISGLFLHSCRMICFSYSSHLVS